MPASESPLPPGQAAPRPSQRPVPRCAALLLAAAASLFATAATAELYQPRSDAEVVEILADSSAARSEERGLRKRLVADPDNAALAVTLARRYLEMAREQAEPRFAGRALAVLQPWQPLGTAPADVVLISATLRQHLHEFDEAAAMLEHLVQREPQHAQAWLTLATIRRVQGRYHQSDAACNALLGKGVDFYAQACLAENQGLRGRFDQARNVFDVLLATKALAPASRAWLLTSVAELEARAGRASHAEVAYRAALSAAADDYARLSYADFLIANNRQREVAAVLRRQPRSDAVLLRLAIAGVSSSTAQSPPPEATELRARMQQAALRPQTRTTHAREQAMFALFIENDADRALELARNNVELQREPVDLLLLAQAARAANNAAALQQTRQIRSDMRIRDARLDALL